jgi:hypothetical protein
MKPATKISQTAARVLTPDALGSLETLRVARRPGRVLDDGARRGQSRAVFAMLRCLAALPAAAWLLSAPARSEGFDIAPTLSTADIGLYATPFLQNQDEEGGYDLGPTVQRHLKAEIAMAVASQATGQGAYAQSALLDMQWVIAHRLEPDGGLNWDGPWNPYFFECHQHWFLIASELIRTTTGVEGNIRDVQRQVWRYLLETNPADDDFYLNNLHNHGSFFGYRSVDRLGVFQSQAPFKGSYEVGVALWSLALHEDSSWLDGQDSVYKRDEVIARIEVASTSEYLRALESQVSRSAQDDGFVDPGHSRWIRSLLWTGNDWSGWDQPDWKYALHMQEGALLCEILTGEARLEAVARSEAENLIAHVLNDGSIETIPDEFGSIRYEYGEALSALGLAALAFGASDPDLAGRSLLAGQAVAQHVLESFAPVCEEDGALLLAGLARVYQAQTADSLAASGIAELPSRWGAALKVWPNPARAGFSVQCAMGPNATGILRIIDVSGRECARMPLSAGACETHTLVWSASDAGLRPLPAGRYTALLEAGASRQAASFLIVR